MPAKVISIVNMKGGVGKTTLTRNLGFAFFESTILDKSRYNKVLLIDLDPQFNLSQTIISLQSYRKLYIDDNKPTINELFLDGTNNPGTNDVFRVDISKLRKIVKYYTNDPGKLDIIASKMDLARALMDSSKKYKLKNYIDTIKNDYDIILIDCAPTDSLLTESAYLASDGIFIPTKPEAASGIGLLLIQNSINRFNSEYDRKLQVFGVAINDLAKLNNKNAIELFQKLCNQIQTACQKYEWHLFEEVIEYSTSYNRADSVYGGSIFKTKGVHKGPKRVMLSLAESLQARIDTLI